MVIVGIRERNKVGGGNAPIMVTEAATEVGSR